MINNVEAISFIIIIILYPSKLFICVLFDTYLSYYCFQDCKDIPTAKLNGL